MTYVLKWRGRESVRGREGVIDCEREREGKEDRRKEGGRERREKEKEEQRRKKERERDSIIWG